ncbi:MAG: hypothetical protein KF882_01490 [Bacteroidia bacterium]|nr:hypothetical protein [Bacteroidia bacterium]MCO5253236.1 hypothetical protein [Bacteroidota bacterium]
MRKYAFLLVSLICSTLLTHAQKNVFFDKLQNINDVYYYNDSPFTGLSLVRHDSTNKKKIQIQWKDGLMDGQKITWYKDERLKQTMNFTMGKRNGEYVNYYENGNVKERGFYYMDSIDGKNKGYYETGQLKFDYFYIKGVQADTNTMYFENGQMEQQFYLKNSRIDGAFRAWYPDGKPMKEFMFKNGLYNGTYKEWHMDGTIAVSGQYTDGLKDGKFESYEIFVKSPLRIEYYKMGLKDSTWITFGLEGDTTTVAHYTRDTLNGEYVEKMEGKIENKGNYIMGVKDGFWQQNLVTLIGASEGTYKMGVKVGVWKLYDFKGKWLASITFDDNGEIIDEYWYGMKKRKSKK